jgi:hypothetical protein
VRLHLLKDVSSVCRLCKSRTKQSERLVLVELVDGKADFYCHFCYEYLRVRLAKDVKDPPAYSELVVGAPFAITLPSYLVKEKHALTFYYPADEIDLGLLKQRRKAQGG